MMDRFLASLAVAMVHLYQVSWSRGSRPRCLFSPSCSQRAVQIFSENGFFRGMGRVRTQLADCQAEYSIRFDAADRPELVAQSGQVYAWHELSDVVPPPLCVKQHTEHENCCSRNFATSIHPLFTDAEAGENPGQLG
jgi:putative component of membrane protein insertase Oxa1/YidC/SpoIIIJ protein YidD